MSESSSSGAPTDGPSDVTPDGKVDPESGWSALRPQRIDRGQYESADVTAYLLAGPITFGGLGWWGDHALDVGFLTPIGALVGLGVALYVVYVRYGKV